MLAKLARVPAETRERIVKRMGSPLIAARALHTAERRIRETQERRDQPAQSPSCKQRPFSAKSKGGGSRNFIPWCDRRKT